MVSTKTSALCAAIVFLFEPMVKLHDNFAISIFICHTSKTARGKHQEKRIKFYDGWKNINGQWKAVSSQATVIEETQ